MGLVQCPYGPSLTVLRAQFNARRGLFQLSYGPSSTILRAQFNALKDPVQRSYRPISIVLWTIFNLFQGCRLYLTILIDYMQKPSDYSQIFSN